MRSPNAAAKVYNLDGNSTPRLKNLFAIRFRRAFPSQNDWENDMTFIAKSVDRPSITMETQEVSQYGKKRLIYTGWKGQPVRMSFNDTADGMATKMWASYSSYYMGDFAQPNDAAYKYDVVTQRMIGDDFGYRPRPANEQAGMNSQFFFNAIEIIQVFGGYYTQMDLINPKIASFDADELNYESSDTASITMTVQYEGIQYRNDGVPRPIAQDALVSSIFGGKFNGNGVEVSGPTRTSSYGTGSPTASNAISQAIGTILTGGAIAAFQQTRGFSQGGALDIFGRYVFSAGNNAINSSTGINVASLSTIRGVGDLFRR